MSDGRMDHFLMTVNNGLLSIRHNNSCVFRLSAPRRSHGKQHWRGALPWCQIGGGLWIHS